MLEPFGSGDEARRIAAGLDGEVLGYVPSPRRPGQARTELLAVSSRSISVISAAGPTREVSIDRMHGLEATFSTLRGRIAATATGGSRLRIRPLWAPQPRRSSVSFADCWRTREDVAATPVSPISVTSAPDAVTSSSQARTASSGTLERLCQRDDCCWLISKPDQARPLGRGIGR